MSGDEGSQDGTGGSGTRPEGNTRRDPPDRRAGQSSLSSDPLIGEVLLERYRVLRRIGSGGMGAVYAAEQVTVGREVALKILRTDVLDHEGVRLRFRREAEIIARLTHPSTIRLIDYGETPDGRALMVMELLEGAPLNQRLRAEGPMEVLEVLRIGEEVARALAEAHREGLVHRDLKPANIFLVDRDEVRAKVLDFGIARIMDEEATRMTAEGQIFGTPRYMSPEQAVSTASVGPLSDVYSLGLILYEALVGQPPFVAETSLQYMSAHTTQVPPKLRERFPAAPAALEALIDACLEKEPTARPPGAVELAEALARIRRDLEGGTAATSHPITDFGQTGWAPPPPPKPASGASFAAALAVGGLLLLIGAGALVYALKGRAPRPLPGSADAASIAVALTEEDAGRREADSQADGRGSTEAFEAPDGETAPSLSPDGGTPDPATPDGGAASGPADRPRPRKDKPKRLTADPPVGTGAVTGPRGLVIPSEALEGPDLSAVAKSCTVSEWRGVGRLSTRGCRDGCAILVDEICAGRTPAKQRAVGPGLRRVAVVCSGKTVKRASITFAQGRTRVLRCR